MARVGQVEWMSRVEPSSISKDRGWDIEIWDIVIALEAKELSKMDFITSF